MKKTAVFLSILFGLQSVSLAAVENYQLDMTHSHLGFNVDSTLHSVHGIAGEIESEVNFDSSSGEVILPLTVTIPVAALNTENEKRDKAMRKMFDYEEYPVIRWEAKEVHCQAQQTESEMMCEAQGQLTIKDIEKDTYFKIFLNIDKHSAQANGIWIFNRNDFNLKAPSVLGIIRVAQPVEIEFETHWIKKASL